MIAPNGSAVAVPALRQTLGLPPARPDGTRDLLAVLLGQAEVPGDAITAWPLALGSWPEAWRRSPASGPAFLIALRGLARPYRIAGIWETDPARWGRDTAADPARREVPLRAPAYVAAAVLTGRPLEATLTFGWLNPEEQFAFL